MPSAASVSRSNASGSIAWVARQVQLHVDEGARQVLDRLEALVEGRRLLDLLDQLLRDGLAGLVVQRVGVEHLRRGQPVLEQLRRELDVVARAAFPRASGS